MKKILVVGVALAGLTVYGGSANAGWVPTTDFTMGYASVSQLGDEIGSAFDVLTITGGSGTTGIASQQISSVIFDVGPNCYTCKLTPFGTLTSQFTLGGITLPFDLSYGWSSTGPVDTLILTAPETMTFANLPGTGGENIEAFFDHLNPLVGTSGPYPEALIARFEVPEPFSITILGAGLIGLGIAKRRQTSTV